MMLAYHRLGLSEASSVGIRFVLYNNVKLSLRTPTMKVRGTKNPNFLSKRAGEEWFSVDLSENYLLAKRLKDMDDKIVRLSTDALDLEGTPFIKEINVLRLYITPPGHQVKYNMELWPVGVSFDVEFCVYEGAGRTFTQVFAVASYPISGW